MARKKENRSVAPSVEPLIALSDWWASLWILPPLIALLLFRCWDHSLIFCDSLEYFAPNKFLNG